MTPREIALSICEPWFNGDPCEGCECHKVCTKLVERIEAAFHAERNADTGKTSDHFRGARKMMTTIRSEVTVDTVQSSHIKELYSVDEIREKIESNAYCAELLLQHAMMHLMGNVKPKRKQLTDAEIGAVAADIWGSILIAPQSYQQFARAIIERAQGIGGEE